MNTDYTAGDVKLTKLMLFDIRGIKSVGISDQVVRFDIFESITGPLIFGRIIVNDGISLREKFPIVADKCKVQIEFNTPPLEKVRRFELVVVDVRNVTISPNSTRSAYELILASIEIMSNASILNTTALRSKLAQDYVREIFDRYLTTTKNLHFDSYGTKGIQTMDPVFLKPFQCVDLIRTRSVSTKYISSSYVFFENKRGFNFVPLEYLFERANGRIKDAVFFFDATGKAGVKSVNWRNILAYRHLTQQSTAKMLQQGALKNVSNSIDIRTRVKQQTVFDLAKEQDNFVTADGMSRGYSTSTFEAVHGRYPTTTFNMIKSSKNPESFLDEKIGYAAAYGELISQNIAQILVYGDSALSAGYRIDCRLPDPDGTTKKKENSKFISGEYLISSIRHMFDKTQRWKYHISCELIKGSFGESAAIG